MAVTNQEALELQLSPEKVKMLLIHMDTAGMSENEKYELALVVYQDFKASGDGFDFRPQRFKIQKDSQRFLDPFGNAVEQLEGVMIYKQKTRVLFRKDEKQPLCSSLDDVTGSPRIPEDGSPDPMVDQILAAKNSCNRCPHNAWGSAKSDSGKVRRGKACKEMRRVYLLQKGAQLPIQVSLPPTSVKAWDDYCSARMSQGISDLAAEVVLTLVPAQAGGYDISVIRPKIGRKLPPLELLQFHKMKSEFIDRLRTIEVSADDYIDEDAATNGGTEANVATPAATNEDGLHPNDPMNLI